MRDIALLLILTAMIWAAWLRPWVGVLGLAVLAYMAPHTYALGFMRGFPVYQMLFIVLALSIARDAYLRKIQTLPAWDWRLLIFLLLWACFLRSEEHTSELQSH